MAEKIAWSNLPGIPRLTGYFINRHQKIVNLLGGDWRDDDTRQIIRDQRRAFKHQASLGSAIRESYGNIDIHPAVNYNLDALDRSETVAIVTGQQPGLFGGPLYTFYKALTTIFLARKLQTNPKEPVVPIFWMETADADFSEVNRIGFPPLDEFPRRTVYLLHDIIAGRSARWHELTSEIDSVRDEVIQWLQQLPYKRRYTKLLLNSYYTGRSMADAFRELITGLLGSMGLVLVDPLDPAIIERSREFWALCLNRPERINNAYSVSSREIQDLRLPLQVKLRKNTLPIYRIDKSGIRRRLSGTTNEWYFNSDEQRLSNNELLALINNPSGVFSPAVLLRPLLQDWLLPTWIYVGGAAEIAYHAQIGRAYDQLNIPRPLVAPRIGATLVERPVRRWLDKHNWKIAEVLGGRELLLRTNGYAGTLVELFDNGVAQLNGWLTRIQQCSDTAEINISYELDQAGRKIVYQWEKLHRITIKKIAERDKTRVNHARKLQNHLLPDEMLQERHNNALYYLAHYGDKLIQTIDSEKDLFNPKHIIIDLEQEQ